jgi:V8-like Glu-specific endopeptidase
MTTLSASAHKPTSNRGTSAPTQRFLSREPYFGRGARQPVDANGFEKLAGFKIRKPTLPKRRLRHISELTYGPRSAQLQIAQTTSAQTPVPDTTLYPWRANAQLKISVPGKTDLFLGTGWFIGPYAVITAAHAVFPQEPGVYSGWASAIEVTPGLNGNAIPFQSFSSTLFYCPDGWQSQGDLRLDYGVVLLNQGIGSQVGMYGYATYVDNDLQSAVANLGGYPENQPDGTPANGTQWYSAGNVVNVDQYFIYYQLDSLAGESGSCVYRNLGDQSYAMAIHTAAQSGDSQGALDRGLRITEPVFENLQQWASMTG